MDIILWCCCAIKLSTYVVPTYLVDMDYKISSDTHQQPFLIITSTFIWMERTHTAVRS